ncbi:MAG: 2OG-Fe(II) oxygenase [Deltaproteobacteria bacterium]|nr:MAG: 2OG-Fe(II) oxygenase [Deltaproteobacteria bacterium]
MDSGSRTLEDRLRPEVLRRERPDGGLDLLDPLTERVHALSPREARALKRRDPMLEMRLDRDNLLEGVGAEQLRAAFWNAKLHGRPEIAPAGEVPDVDWAAACAALSPEVAAPWRDPERWRRLAEERAAGHRYLVLRGFLTREAVAALAAEVAALPYVRLETELVRASRCLVADDALAGWRAFMAAPATRTLFGAVLGRELPPGLTMNAWRLDDGDYMGVHPDGRRYQGTLGVGLCEGWRARDGGAIAFGEPGPDGFVVDQRWLPHAGDVTVFAPDADTWHAVEPVVGRRRNTLTGWWTFAEHALS